MKSVCFNGHSISCTCQPKLRTQALLQFKQKHLKARVFVIKIPCKKIQINPAGVTPAAGVRSGRVSRDRRRRPAPWCSHTRGVPL